ncbi:hypothetical protein AZE42_04086 [Rhizopogon vesiculosus]|uniref:Uncharacterized protein n=1 Tax=Rhizopogon vesiculosus TaxID=180088 RepID=A0A1J8QF78_9AGAM|nr:hypothetical protein AZE42_04086 [Rhizopogon vesiculosus]
MSGIRNLLARRDSSGERPSSHEQTRKVELALQSLSPCFTRPPHLQSRGLSHRSSVPSFFSSSTHTKASPRQRKVHQLPPPALNAEYFAQRCPSVVNSPTSPSATPNYLPMPSALHSDFSLLPLTPSPISPATRKRGRFSMLNRKIGEALPPELVLGADPMDAERKAHGAVQKHAFTPVAPATNEGRGVTCDLHISSTEGGSEDDHRPSVPLAQNVECHHITQPNGTTWTLERNGQRIHDYQEMLELLRKL